VLLALVGDWRMALAAATEAREFCASHGLPYDGALATVVVGMATAGLGRDAQGIGHIREGVAMQRRLNGRVFLPLALSRLALAQCASGEMNAALEAAEEAVHVAREGEEFCWEAETLRVRGEVKLAMRVHDVAEVEADVSAAVAIANRQAAKSFELRAATSLARLWHGRGRPGDARNILAPIYTWFTEGFGTPDLIEAKALLDALC